MNVAVIMSVYHKECPNMFARAIESILTQDVSREVNIRIYLGVDGPIPDTLAEVIRKYESRLHKILRFSENRGLAHVLNDLIKVLEDEEYIFRMDTDDVSMPSRFRRQIGYLVLHPEIDILGTSIVEIVEGASSERIVHFSRETEQSVRSIARGVPVAHPTVCFRKAVFEKIGGYPTVRNNEDIALWFQCLQHGLQIANLREVLYEFTVSKDFLGRRGFEKAFTEFLVYTKGIWLLHGFTFDYFYPLARFVLRLSPKVVQKFAYGSRFRPREILSNVQ